MENPQQDGKMIDPANVLSNKVCKGFETLSRNYADMRFYWESERGRYIQDIRDYKEQCLSFISEVRRLRDEKKWLEGLIEDASGIGLSSDFIELLKKAKNDVDPNIKTALGLIKQFRGLRHQARSILKDRDKNLFQESELN